MSNVSVIFDLSENIMAQMTAWAGLTDVDLNYTEDMGQMPPEAWVNIGGPSAAREWAVGTGVTLGGMDEDGELPIEVQVSQFEDKSGSRETTRLMRARAAEIIHQFELCLASDPTLAGLVQWAIVTDIAESSQGTREIGEASSFVHWVKYEVKVSFKARIYPGEP